MACPTLQSVRARRSHAACNKQTLLDACFVQWPGPVSGTLKFNFLINLELQLSGGCFCPSANGIMSAGTHGTHGVTKRAYWKSTPNMQYANNISGVFCAGGRGKFGKVEVQMPERELSLRFVLLRKS